MVMLLPMAYSHYKAANETFYEEISYEIINNDKFS